MNTPKEVLLDIARELREQPEKWTREAWARTPDGRATFPTDPRATCWCLGGHVRRRAPKDPELIRESLQRLHKTLNVRNHFSVAHFNDAECQRVENVIAVCEEAAKL